MEIERADAHGHTVSRDVSRGIGIPKVYEKRASPLFFSCSIYLKMRNNELIFLAAGYDILIIHCRTTPAR